MTPLIRRALTAAVACALVVAAGCNSKRTPPTNRAGGAVSEKADAARKMAAALAVEAVKGGAAEQAKLSAFGKGGFFVKTGIGEVAAKIPLDLAKNPKATPKAEPNRLANVPPRPTSPVVISDRVSSALAYTLAAEADEDALLQAQERVAQRLRELRPPVNVRPPLDAVRSEYVRRDTRTVRYPGPQESELLKQNGYSAERVYVEYDVQVTADQVRVLRTRDRIDDALRAIGVLTAAALAAFLFLRLDEWTKGYLTSRLAVAAIVLAVGVTAAAVFI